MDPHVAHFGVDEIAPSAAIDPTRIYRGPRPPVDTV
jgi:hypothetical protein